MKKKTAVLVALTKSDVEKDEDAENERQQKKADAGTCFIDLTLPLMTYLHLH
jgi:hypothetical protein